MIESGAGAAPGESAFASRKHDRTAEHLDGVGSHLPIVFYRK
jgi:hypothetical protein